MTHRLLFCGASLLACWIPAFAQAPAAAPGATKLEFEVASVKPAAPMTGGFMRVSMNADAGRLDYENVSLKDVVRIAYRLKDFQVSGPDWLANARFDIDAKYPEGVSKDQVPEMLQALLAERFKIAVHHETKPHDAYVLVAPKGAAKLTPSEPDDPNGKLPEGIKGFSGPNAATAVSGGGGGKPEGGMTRMTFSRSDAGGGGGGGMAMGKAGPGADGTIKMQMKGQTLDGFATMLARYLGSPVTNLTEIEGKYDFALEVSMAEMSRGAGMPLMKGLAGGGGSAGDVNNPAGDLDADSGALMRSLQNYGLKLDKKKEPMDLLVVDHIEKTPTEN